MARGQREPGTLMLTMIVKNEASRLDTSLPVWAPLIDYWVIGVDRNNTDTTEEVIHKHLGKVPGEILIVDFDGMGPTWTKVVEHGLKMYPQATHGILSDADFTPLGSTLSKWDLDRSCSKHSFTVLEADGTGTRIMDWIYRNIPGARVERRTHQILLVPRTSEHQDTYQRQIGFTVKEFTGGYQDRAGNKSGRYIEWLLKDLEELPGDARTIYYLGKEHMELIGPNPVADLRKTPPGPGAYHVRQSLYYYQQRAAMEVLAPDSDRVDEERYWAMLKAAEICERWLFNSTCCLQHWQAAWDLDPPRADAPFYIGQHYRLRRDGKNAVKYLRKTVRMSMPHRTNYQWPYLYDCLRHLELVRAGSYMTLDFYLSGEAWKEIRKSYSIAMQNCPREDTQNLGTSYDQARARREKCRAEKKSRGLPQASSPPAPGPPPPENTPSPSSPLPSAGIPAPSSSRGNGGKRKRTADVKAQNRNKAATNGPHSPPDAAAGPEIMRPMMVDHDGKLVPIPDDEL